MTTIIKPIIVNDCNKYNDLNETHWIHYNLKISVINHHTWLNWLRSFYIITVIVHSESLLSLRRFTTSVSSHFRLFSKHSSYPLSASLISLASLHRLMDFRWSFMTFTKLIILIQLSKAHLAHFRLIAHFHLRYVRRSLKLFKRKSHSAGWLSHYIDCICCTSLRLCIFSL